MWGRLLSLVAVAFVALAELTLSEPLFPFQPDLGELGWPAAAALTVLSAPLLWWAGRPDGALLKRPWLLGGLAVVGWLALARMVYVFGTEPWALYHIPGWLDPGTTEYRLSAAFWYPLHPLHALGPLFLVLAASARQQPLRARLGWLAAGGLPWVAASALFVAAASQEPPIWLG